SIPGRRVVDDGGSGSEIAISKIQRRDRHHIRIAAVISDALIVSEEERLVLPDSSSNSKSELIVDRWRLCTGKKIAGGQLADPIELIDAAMEAVGARTQRHLGYRPPRSTKPPTIFTGRNIHG